LYKYAYRQMRYIIGTEVIWCALSLRLCMPISARSGTVCFTVGCSSENSDATEGGEHVSLAVECSRSLLRLGHLQNALLLRSQFKGTNNCSAPMNCVFSCGWLCSIDFRCLAQRVWKARACKINVQPVL
jgi:hypothetical protein